MPTALHPVVVAALTCALALVAHAGTPASTAPGPDRDGPSSTERPGGPTHRVPLATGSLLEPFRRPQERWTAGHRGVDLLASPGTPVLAPAAGVVTFAGTVVDRGVVTVTHPDGLRTSLEPVVPRVDAGARVSAGQEVAVVGAGGHCGDRIGELCLHWGVRRGETYLDPLTLLGHPEPVVLLPVPASLGP